MSTLIYSRWRPDTGSYDYFRSSFSQNINDDLPAPELVGTKIGVPSIEAGRPIPSDAVRAGSGDIAKGVVAPVDGSRIVRRTRSLSGSDAMGAYGSPWFYLGGAIAVGLIFYVMKDR